VKNRLLWGLVAAVVIEGLVAAGYFWGNHSASEKRIDETGPAPALEPRVGNQADLAKRMREVAARQNTESTKMPPAPTPLAQPTEQPLSPAEARNREIEKLRASGPDARELMGPAQKVGAAWAAAARSKKLEITFSDWECHAAGCFVTASSHDGAALVSDLTEQITHSPMFHRWNGTKLRTNPVPDVDQTGKQGITWVLFSPPEGETTLSPASAFGGTDDPAPTRAQ
jgi:type IV secretory pathway VirB10-like protein